LGVFGEHLLVNDELHIILYPLHKLVRECLVCNNCRFALNNHLCLYFCVLFVSINIDSLVMI
jgi:hypothetical protein